jgi:heme-degrading monooxygenase HmoA
VHARVSTYTTEDPEGLIEGFKRVSSDLEQVDGFSHAYFLVDKDGGKALSITIWESEDALNASRSQADELRRRGTEASGTSIDSVDHYEISHTVGSGSGSTP